MKPNEYFKNRIMELQNAELLARMGGGLKNKVAPKKKVPCKAYEYRNQTTGRCRMKRNYKKDLEIMKPNEYFKNRIMELQNAELLARMGGGGVKNNRIPCMFFQRRNHYRGENSQYLDGSRSGGFGRSLGEHCTYGSQCDSGLECINGLCTQIKVGSVCGITAGQKCPGLLKCSSLWSGRCQ